MTFLHLNFVNELHFIWVYRRNKPTRDVTRTREKLLNNEPEARDLYAFIKQLEVAANFYELTGTISHSFLTNQNARTHPSCFINDNEKIPGYENPKPLHGIKGT